MLFNSPTFAVFFAAVLVLYWSVAVGGIRRRNAFLIAASYVFYGWWDWRFLGLIVVSSAVDYIVARRIAAADDSSLRRRYLCISLAVNLGALATLKYFNFFCDSLRELVAGTLGNSLAFESRWLDWPTLNIILPVGISFYTLQTLSYTIDVYRRRIPASDQPLAFFAYVCFFPQLVAGPIERAADLLPQFGRISALSLDDGRDGLRQILWGLFKKVVVADTCGQLADPIFSDWASHSGATIALATFYFGFQIYGDFSGYSDIAIGTARLLGFNLRTNFDRPYFAVSISDFWRRWHISLSTWFRDYVYIPLGGNRGTKAAMIRHLFIVFSLSGLWHGASLNFLVWGILHWAYLCVEKLLSRFASDRGRWTRVAGAFMTLPAVMFAWIFFRLTDIHDATGAAGKVLGPTFFEKPDATRMGLLWIALLLSAEWYQQQHHHPLHLRRWPWVARWALYLAMAVLLLGFYRPRSSFIYFQF